MIGQTLSHEILEKIGEGGMKVVYKARDPTRCSGRFESVQTESVITS